MPREKPQIYGRRRLQKTGGRFEDTRESKSILFKLEDGKRLAHTATHGYKITMASLQPDDRRLPNCVCNTIIKRRKKSESDSRVVVIIEHNLEEHIICILNCGEFDHCKLDLMIQPGEQVAYRTIGKVPVLLSGITSDAH